MLPIFRSEEITSASEAQLVGAKLPFDNDRDIQQFWSDSKMVIHLASYLARTVDYDTHWSKKICELLFSEAYLKNHLWPAETYVFVSI